METKRQNGQNFCASFSPRFFGPPSTATFFRPFALSFNHDRRPIWSTTGRWTSVLGARPNRRQIWWPSSRLQRGLLLWPQQEHRTRQRIGLLFGLCRDVVLVVFQVPRAFSYPVRWLFFFFLSFLLWPWILRWLYKCYLINTWRYLILSFSLVWAKIHFTNFLFKSIMLPFT